MLRKPCSGEETPMGCHPPFAFWQPFGFGLRPIPPSSQPGRAAAFVPKGAAISAQDRAADRTLIIQGRRNRWPSFHRGLGWQLPPSPTTARGPGRLPARVQLRSQGVTVTAGNQEVGAGVLETHVLCQHPAILSSQKASHSVPLRGPACPFIQALQSIWSFCCVPGTVSAPGGHPHQRSQHRFRVPLQ